MYCRGLKYYNTKAGATSTFGFSYDNLNRLTNTSRYEGAGTTASSTFTERNLSYDANGNILTLSRYGADAATPEDNFTYTYNGNKLVNLSGTYNGTSLNNASYAYDGNGNMTHDGRMNLDVTYDLFGMPQSVQQNGTLKCVYTYLADGTKVMVQDDANSSLSNGYLYLGSMVFRKTGTSYAFESTDFGGGRIINLNGTLSPYYYTTDHLGSVRVITDANGNVTERNDYYPFGKRMTTGNTYPTTSSNRWKYNGKEVQTTGDVNWLDYGAREYDEVIGRWTRPDPMSEKYYGTSGYAYCVDNPISLVDPNGKSIWKPEYDKINGVSYVAEKGDNINTLIRQYNLNAKTANNIIKEQKISSSQIKEGTKISGTSVEKATGSEVLKLDLGSKQNTEQRQFDQLVFGLNHSKKSGDTMSFSDYFSNIDNGTTTMWGGAMKGIAGNATMSIHHETFPVYYNTNAVLGVQTIYNSPYEIGPSFVKKDKMLYNIIRFSSNDSNGQYPLVQLFITGHAQNASSIYDYFLK